MPVIVARVVVIGEKAILKPKRLAMSRATDGISYKDLIDRGYVKFNPVYERLAMRT